MAFKGHIPWNKGMKGCTNKGSFQKGHKQSNTGKTHYKKGSISYSKLYPKCMQRGKNHWQWKGGKFKRTDGYIFILKPKHPFASPNGYVMEHRFVMERYIGRYLFPKERVHHINEIRNDNRIENLILFKNGGYHNQFHKKGFCNPIGIIFDGSKH